MKKVLLFVALFVVAMSLTIGIDYAFAGDNTSGSQAGAAAQAEISIKDQSTSIVVDRDFVGTSQPVVAGTNGYFVEGLGNDVSFRRVNELIKFGDVFSESSLRNLAKGGDVKYHFSPVNDYNKPSNKLRDGQRYIKIAIEVMPGFKMSAPLDAAADDFETNSFQIIARMALKALSNGDNILYVEFEGFKDRVGASGWGIGTHSAVGYVNPTGSVSGVGGGGMGYSSNEVGPEMLPWIRGYSGCLPYELTVGMSAGKTSSFDNSNAFNREGN